MHNEYYEWLYFEPPYDPDMYLSDDDEDNEAEDDDD